MQVKIIADVSTEPLTEAVIKNYIKYDESDATEVALINNMAKAAREACERYTDLAFAQKTIEVHFENSEVKMTDSNRIVLPFAPHSSITYVKTVDYEGTETELTLNTSYYKFGLTRYELQIQNIVATVGMITTESDVKVKYVCGYGASECESIPQGLIIAMAKQVADWYENREAYAMSSLTNEVKQILNRYTVNVYI